MSAKIEIKAKIYAVTDGMTAKKAFANVAIGNLFNINSYVVTNTYGNPERMVAFPPSRRDSRSGEYKSFIEFAHPKDNKMVEAIQKACHSAYEFYSSTGRLHEYGRAFVVDIDNLFGSREKCAENRKNTDSINSQESPDEFLGDSTDIKNALAEAGF